MKKGIVQFISTRFKVKLKTFFCHSLFRSQTQIDWLTAMKIHMSQDFQRQVAQTQKKRFQFWTENRLVFYTHTVIHTFLVLGFKGFGWTDLVLFLEQFLHYFKKGAEEITQQLCKQSLTGKWLKSRIKT